MEEAAARDVFHRIRRVLYHATQAEPKVVSMERTVKRARVAINRVIAELDELEASATGDRNEGRR